MKKIETQIDIETPLVEVWNLFSDFEKYNEWNPFLIEVKGSLIEGSIIKISARFNDGNIRMAEPKVEKVIFGKEVYFLAKKRFLFTGRHYFIFEAISNTRTRFIHGECFSGLLPLLLWHKIEPSFTVSFGEMNQALKARAENT